ncbi:MAG: hypothetical protein ACE5KD_01320 [Candidatus Bathyarchaeia archaeon]
MLNIFGFSDVSLIDDKLETRSMLVGVVLCIIGLVVFLYGISSMTPLNAVSNSFLIVIGIFLGIAGFLVIVINAFSGGSILS